MGSTYGIASSVFLLSSNDGSASLGGVEGRLSSNNGLARGTTAPNLASNLGDRIPVIHGGGC